MWMVGTCPYQYFGRTELSLPIFWEDRIVPPNISSNSITLFFMYTYDVGVGGGLLSLPT